MKETTQSNEAEPTIKEVMGAVKDLSVTVQDLTEAVQTGFAKVEARLNQHENIIKTLVEGQSQIREDIHLLDQRVSKTQHRVEDVVDEQGETLLDHGRRITVLEKARA